MGLTRRNLPALLAFWLVAPLHGLAAPNLDWQTAAGHRWANISLPAEGKTGFSLLPPDATGIRFTNHLSDRTVAVNRIYENGSGVALGDVDGDGWCDVYFCRLEGDNVLYRNRGQWQFEDITASAGVACPNQYSTGAVLADLDGDGDLDLLVNSIGGGTRSFFNDGQGRFNEITETRLVRRFGSTSMALADIDADGDLDLYVTNYRTTTYKDRPPGLKVEARMVNGKIVVTPEDRFVPIMPRAGGVEVIEKGDRDFLYINDGRGRFAPVSWTAGSFLDEEGKPLTAPPTDWGLAVMLRDINGDGAPDIYVCNDFFYWPDRVWLNENSSRFRAIPRTALRNQSLSSMAVDFADINRDGFDDFFVADMLSRKHAFRHRQRPNTMKGILQMPAWDLQFRPEVTRNTLCLNRGDGTWAEIAQFSGVEASEWSWGAMFLDVDLDGFEDLLIPTGNNHDVQDGDVIRELASIRELETPDARVRNLNKFPRLETPSIAFRNRRDLTFEEVGAQWGFNTVGLAHGMAAADLDLDGDLDLVMNRLHSHAAIYRNDSTAPRIAVRLKGLAPNTRGIGAKIKITGGPVTQTQEMICGGRYVSGDEAVRVFAAGTTSNRLNIQVTWRTGRQTAISGVLPNRIYEMAESSTASSETIATSNPPLQSVAPHFEDVSLRLTHRHVDEPFNDFERQPLLDRQLSHLGPGLAWADTNEDGAEDLIIGSGVGGRLALFRNQGQGDFKPFDQHPITQPVTRDLTSILVWWRAPGDPVILAGLSHHEDKEGTRAAIRMYDLKGQLVNDSFPATEDCSGPLAMADMDGDGDLDLFVGGRALPGKYPQASSSRIFRNEKGKLIPDESNQAPFEKIGLISGAVFSDLDLDGDADLVLAREWGSLIFFRNEKGNFRDDTASTGLAEFRGLWQGVTAADVNGDGQLDLIASNWGRNCRYRTPIAHSVRIYYGDFDGNGTVDLLETYFEPELNKWVPWRDWETVTKAIPGLEERIPSYRAFGMSSIEEIIGERFHSAQMLSINTLDSAVFVNSGGRFQWKPLPAQAQFAPAFGVAVADFDGDGREDIFLAQNFFGVETDTSRQDAGTGLWLRGNGQGEFTPVPPAESGLKIYGEQRGCAIADFDGDGRPDLAVGQNRAETKLSRNARAQPGLRVRLVGPPENPHGVGAMVQLRFNGKRGPVREIQAGSGYWSQNSPVQVLATPEKPTHLLVRWPGGKLTETPLPDPSREVAVELTGALKSVK
ncbi:MAG: CRTAC1 family protein [Verrucomicrobiota bacterium]